MKCALEFGNDGQGFQQLALCTPSRKKSRIDARRPKASAAAAIDSLYIVAERENGNNILVGNGLQQPELAISTDLD
eukprot:scaffold25074_cov157-Cylindrotheca_fusiformis.AAC.3